MSAVLNDRDAILQAAGTRIVNPKNADIMLDMSAPAFHVNAAGVADVPSITITGMLVGLEGTLSWSVQGATLSNVTDRSATVTYASMQGATAIVTASMTSSGELFSRSRVLATMQDGLSGANAKTVKLTPSEQVFKISKAGANSPASITFTAVGQNTAGVPSFTIPVGTATLSAGSNASQKVLTFANMTTDSVTVEVTLDGQKDRVTIYKLREGQDGQPGVDAIVGLLTNESVTLPAGSNGVVSSFSNAVCTMVMYKGAADDSANWTYAFSPASASNRLSYTTSGSTVTLTGMAAGVDSSYVDITASKAGAASVTKRIFVTKSKAGASVTGARGAGQYYVVGSVWSDVVAQAACPGGPVVNDQVTISNGTVTYTKRWDGSVWYVPGAYLSGDLFVEGDINGSKLKVGTVQVTTPAGVPVVTIGGLQPGFEAPGTKNSELAPSIAAAAATADWDGIADIPYQSILNNDDSVALGFNPSFSDWTGNYPAGWSNAATSNLPVKEMTIKRLGKWSMKYTGNGSTNMGITKAFEFKNTSGAFEPLQEGTFLSGTIDMYLANIVSGLPQVIVRLYHSSVMGNPYTDLPVKPQATADMWQRVQFKHKLAAGLRIHAIRFYFFGSYSGNGGHYNGTVYFDNFRFALFDSSLDNTAISIGADGRLGGAGGGQVTINGLGYSGALDATKGAPAGTMVGGTEAGLVASRALNGDTALSAVNNASTGLASKLATAGNQSLTGPIALTANGAVVVGTVNDGVRINTGGIIGRKAGSTTFSIAADGTALFGGALAAAWGTLGKLQVLDTLYGGDFTGFDWPSDKTKRGWAISTLGAIFGNYNDGQWFDIQANGNVTAPGFQLVNKQLTLDRTIIVNPRISQPVLDSFAYTVAGGGTVSGPNGALGNSVTLTVSGNNAPHKIVWNFARLVGGLPSVQVLMSTGDGGRTCGINATASNTSINVQVSAVITGTDGRTLNYSDTLTLVFGTG